MLFVCSLWVAKLVYVSVAVFVSLTRGVYLKRNKAAAAFDGGVSFDAPCLGNDDAEEIPLTKEGFVTGRFSITTSL